MTKVFGELPEAVLDSIFEFANDGPLKLVFDAKKKKFVNKINKNFVELKKALQFKIDNPPSWDVDDPNFEYEIGTTSLDIVERLSFKYPLKLRIRPGCRDGWHCDDGYLSLDFYYSKSFYNYITTKCTVSLPEYYIKNKCEVAKHYKRLSEHKNFQTDEHKFRLRNMVKGLETISYASDVEIY
jgi:hypothetical protein